MKYDLYLVYSEEGIEVWPISDAGADAVKKLIPPWGLGEKVTVQMMQEEFQALFPPPLEFLAQNPNTDAISAYSRKPVQ
jgi:hypothetical protein